MVEVTFEADGPKAFDDVVVRYEPGRPSATGPGRVTVDYHQIKWHVDRSGRFGFKDLTRPEFIGATAVSILERLRQAKEKAPEGAAFHLITTDKLRDDDQLSELVSPIDGSLRLHKLREGKTAASRMGGWVDEVHDGVIGVARRGGADEDWTPVPPILESIGVNSELERPHIVLHDGLYYLFWSTQAKRFADGIGAPTGLYGMVAQGIAGPWRPLNGSGLVAANPAAEPCQAYCWWVTGELDVLSFADFSGLAGAEPVDAATRRAHFGGTAAPWFRLRLKGDVAEIGKGRG